MGVGAPEVRPKNLEHRGLRSVDRSNKATLPRTRPGAAFKSYARDPSPRMVKLQSAGWAPGLHAREPAAGLLRYRAEAYSYPTTMCGRKSPRSGMDSDLEAFSHNPADGSFAALPGRTAAKTNYLNQRFLSY
jgi:hypothetical protein